MALPSIASAIYTLTIPSTKKQVRYKPFTVREQKALLIAQQSEDQTIMVDTLKSVIKSCILDSIDVDSLATFDIEYMFLQIRAKSVGEVTELLFICRNCQERTKITFDITNINVLFPSGHTNKIDLGDGLGVIMRYPTLDVLRNIDRINTEDVHEIFEIITSCIDQIYDAQQVYHTKDHTQEELSNFVESLSAQQFTKLQEFFETMPRLEKRIEFVCPKCEHKQESVLKGLTDFF